MGRGLSTYSLFKTIPEGKAGVHLLTQEETKAVQRVLLLMMDDLSALCERHGLCCILYGGAVLGQRREGGFIPWDDDMDVAMPRRDYEKLLGILQEECAASYEVQEIRTCRDYDLGFMKIRKKGTIFSELLEPEPEKTGIFIDIFPIENVFSHPIARAWQRFWTDGLQFVCSCIRIRRKRKRILSMLDDQKQRRLVHIKSAVAIPFCLIPFHRWLLWTDKAARMCQDENSGMVSVPFGSKHFKGEMFPKSWLLPGQMLPFAGRSYRFVNEPDAYLAQIYGPNYMTPPKEQERQRHALRSFRTPEGED